MDYLQEIFMVLLPIVGTVATLLVQRFKKRLESNDSKFTEAENAIRYARKIYEELNYILAELDADFVILLKATNGGGIPQPGKQIKSTVLYEVYDKMSDSLKKNWQNQALDEVYCSMLSRVVQNGYTVLVTKELTSSDLKNLYESRGIVKSVVYKVYTTDRAFYYLSVPFKKDVDVDTPAFKTLLRSSIHVISEYLQKGKEV